QKKSNNRMAPTGRRKCRRKASHWPCRSSPVLSGVERINSSAPLSRSTARLLHASVSIHAFINKCKAYVRKTAPLKSEEKVRSCPQAQIQIAPIALRKIHG